MSPKPKEAILKAISALDKAAEKGVIHKNNAARRKGRLMKKLASLRMELLRSADFQSKEDLQEIQVISCIGS